MIYKVGFSVTAEVEVKVEGENESMAIEIAHSFIDFADIDKVLYVITDEEIDEE